MMSQLSVPTTEPPAPYATLSRSRPENFTTSISGSNDQSSDTLYRISTESPGLSIGVMVSQSTPPMGGISSDATLETPPSSVVP